MQSRDVISEHLGAPGRLNGTGGHWVWAKAVGASVLVLAGGAIRAKPPIFVEKNAVSWSGPLRGWLGGAGNTAAKG